MQILFSFQRQGRNSSPEIFKDFVRRTHCRDDIDISLLQFIPNIDGSNTQGEGGKRGGGVEGGTEDAKIVPIRHI